MFSKYERNWLSLIMKMKYGRWACHDIVIVSTGWQDSEGVMVTSPSHQVFKLVEINNPEPNKKAIEAKQILIPAIIVTNLFASIAEWLFLPKVYYRSEVEGKKKSAILIHPSEPALLRYIVFRKFWEHEKRWKMLRMLPGGTLQKSASYLDDALQKAWINCFVICIANLQWLSHVHVFIVNS